MFEAMNAKANLFFNRELSWLEFDTRVLLEASNAANPLFERLRFLSISANNLDEFFMVRVGSLTEQVEAGITAADPSGLTPSLQLSAISEKVHALVEQQYEIYNTQLIPALEQHHIRLIDIQNLDSDMLPALDTYFTNEVYPVLTPMAVDAGRPFPLILNQSLNIGVLLTKPDSREAPFFATVQVPSVLPRLIRLGGTYDFILLEDLIMLFMERLFTAHKVLSTSPYRITRNADLALREEEADDLLEEMERFIKKRKRGDAIRLEITRGVAPEVLNTLMEALEIYDAEVYDIQGPIDLKFVSRFIDLKEHALTFPPFRPRPVKAFSEDKTIFQSIRHGDIFLHHPYDSFDPVVDFVAQAAKDPNVLAIKQTLYRVSGNSPIIKALETAAEAGKQVTVLVEVKARFDEENNIHWAKRLEQAGCHVIYGLPGLKTHCKITLVVRRQVSGIKRYVHLGTGNYNDVTARLYTDMGLFTCNDYIASDASAIFNMLSGYSKLPDLYKLIPAPAHLRTVLLTKIQQETTLANEGKPAYIFCKCNALVDVEIIKALYEASSAGVKVDLLIRGICCLIPGLPGISDNITVTSIVGRFLEHSRIYYFRTDGKDEVYLSSADLMPRNLDRRVELMFPIEDRRIKDKILHIIDCMRKDNKRAKQLTSSGAYIPMKCKRSVKKIDSQKYFMDNEI